MKGFSLLLLAITLLLGACSSATNADHTANSEKKEEHAGHGSGESVGKSDIQAVFKMPSETAPSKQDTAITIQILDKDGKAINDFELNHEKMMHLIVVSQDLSFYKHIHPTYEGKGLFKIHTTFPAGGEYKLFADFKPKGLDKVVKSHLIKATGDTLPASVLKPDSKRTATVNGVEVSLSMDHLMAGMELDLTYSFKDAVTKSPITNLQPYLGAVGHVVILDLKADQYLHVHPVDEKSTGPEATFKTSFPKSGLYKVWGEFQRDGQVFTVPFVVEVP